MTKATSITDDKNFLSITQALKNGQMSHKRSIPPLAQWYPKHCGKMDLTIKANGEWWHEGQLIKRQALLDLFSSVLWLQDGKYYLKTPIEQIEIAVEDAPLLVNDVNYLEISGKKYIQLLTTNQDEIIVDEQHAIFMKSYQGAMRPYVHVRFGLNALIQRHVFFHLVEMGELLENEAGNTILSLKSGDFYLQLST